ncbi:MAG: lipopolysaccharide heptosyltransferase II [Nitrospiraceae bacterium]|nr:MAG: lipopolysaccharide heptosyltransferase II [Nitrospiraceae bacterium]
MEKTPQHILIRGVNWIGDAVLTIPAIRSVRRAFPDARICLLVKPWVADIFRENPDIDEIVLYDKSFIGLSGKLRLAKKLRQKKFDVAILLQNAFDAALIAWLARIPRRIGYRRDGRGFLLSQAVPVSDKVLEKHQVYYYLDLLACAGIKPSDPHPYLYLTDGERQRAKDLLSSYFSDTGALLIGINPGATYGSAKRWPPGRFAELIIRIISELGGQVILFGGPSEVEITDEIIREINKLKIQMKIERLGARILIMAGKTSLRELAALIAACDAFITNDSGPMHMASALRVPTAAIFGSTDQTATGPFGEGHQVIAKDIPCAPCMKRECPEGHLKCMMEITTDDVYSALREILPGQRAVFLDKDGTLIEDRNYLNSFDDLHILRGVKTALKRLKEAGFRLIGATNQSGVARGIVDESFVSESNDYLRKELLLDDFYYCPHHPDEKCPCRKPEPLMLLRARLQHRISLKASYVIGDKESDVMLAVKTGATGILLSATPLFEKSAASYISKDLPGAVTWILEREKNRKE